MKKDRKDIKEYFAKMCSDINKAPERLKNALSTK